MLFASACRTGTGYPRGHSLVCCWFLTLKTIEEGYFWWLIGFLQNNKFLLVVFVVWLVDVMLDDNLLLVLLRLIG
jgi:hypothetical protein